MDNRAIPTTTHHATPSSEPARGDSASSGINDHVAEGFSGYPDRLCQTWDCAYLLRERINPLLQRARLNDLTDDDQVLANELRADLHRWRVELALCEDELRETVDAREPLYVTRLQLTAACNDLDELDHWLK